MLIWHHICFAMASLVALSRSLMFLNKGVHVFVLTKLPSSRFIFNLLLLYFDLMISSDSLIFLLYIWLPLIMSLGVDNWINHGILNNVQLHLNFPTFLLCCLVGVQLFWLSLFSLFHLCTLRYKCSLMYKRPGKN